MKPAKNRDLFDDEGPEQSTLFSRAPDESELSVGRSVNEKLAADPEHYLGEYTKEFGNVTSRAAVPLPLP